MKIINFEDLKLDKNYNKGSFGAVFKSTYKNQVYAYKEFNDPKYLEGKKRKLEKISKLNNSFLLTPLYWVRKNNAQNQYLTKFCNGKDISALKSYPIKKRIRLLKKAKNGIEIMHKSGIIHCDLISSNIMVENDNICFIDFDNCAYENYKPNLAQLNDYSFEFINEYGLCEEIDTFLFNLLTFEIINSCDLHSIKRNIATSEYNYFDNDDAKEICESFFLQKRSPEKSFLIDNVNETKFYL